MRLSLGKGSANCFVHATCGVKDAAISKQDPLDRVDEKRVECIELSASLTPDRFHTFSRHSRTPNLVAGSNTYERSVHSKHLGFRTKRVEST